MNEKSQLKYKMIRFNLLLNVPDLIINGLLLHAKGKIMESKLALPLFGAQLTLILNNANQ